MQFSDCPPNSDSFFFRALSINPQSLKWRSRSKVKVLICSWAWAVMPITNVVSPGDSRGWSHPELIQLSGHQQPVSKSKSKYRGRVRVGRHPVGGEGQGRGILIWRHPTRMQMLQQSARQQVWEAALAWTPNFSSPQLSYYPFTPPFSLPSMHAAFSSCLQNPAFFPWCISQPSTIKLLFFCSSWHTACPPPSLSS